MGGLAVVINWDRPVDAGELEPMLALIPHRSAGGVTRGRFTHAALSESRSPRDSTDNTTVTSVGSLSIVGDLRLWSRDGLRARAGGERATRGMDDRRLLLTAYQRSGIDFLDDVDGDFAFVIWDDIEQRVLAVRDRFGTKPLFVERTPTGIRMASEPKQLVATSTRPVTPCALSVAEYLVDQYVETRFSFFGGIERIRPSTALVADPSGESEVRYWNPSPDTTDPAPFGDIASLFREQLTDSVQRRLGTSDATVAHLSGGLDSSAVTAAAHILASRDQLPTEFHTVSAVFPGHDVDESAWIRDVTSAQPFPHQDFVPRFDTVTALESDMWLIDQPQVNRVRDMWAQPAAIANAEGAHLVLSGSGGDEILDEDQLLMDRLRKGPLKLRIHDISAVAASSYRGAAYVTARGAWHALPSRIRRATRRRTASSADPFSSLVAADLRHTLEINPSEYAPTDFGFPTKTQDDLVGSTQDPAITWINEAQEAEYSSLGIDLSQPYFDRRVVEFAASIPIAQRPFTGRSKTLVRSGFAGWLPESVLDRRFKAVADEYLDQLLTRQGIEYRTRYPTVSAHARRFLDPVRYGELLRAFDTGTRGFIVRESLWKAWTLMAWLDQLDRYTVDSRPR